MSRMKADGQHREKFCNRTLCTRIVTTPLPTFLHHWHSCPFFFFFYIELNESEGKEAAHLPVANSKINYLICRLNRLSFQFTLKALNIVPFLTWDRWRIEILFMILSLRLNNMKSAKYQGKLQL